MNRPVGIHHEAMLEAEAAESAEIEAEIEAEAEDPAEGSSMYAEAPIPPSPGDHVPPAPTPRTGGPMDATPPPDPQRIYRLVIRYQNGMEATVNVVGPLTAETFRPKASAGLLAFTLKDGGTKLVRSDLILDIEFVPIDE